MNNIRIIGRIRWLESGSGKMSKQPKPFEYKGKRIPVCPEFFSEETGCLFSNGGGGVHRIYIITY